MKQLEKRIEALEGGKQRQHKPCTPISEKIKLYEKYFSGEIPIPEELKGKINEFEEQLHGH